MQNLWKKKYGILERDDIQVKATDRGKHRKGEKKGMLQEITNM